MINNCIASGDIYFYDDKLIHNYWSLLDLLHRLLRLAYNTTKENEWKCLLARLTTVLPALVRWLLSASYDTEVFKYSTYSSFHKDEIREGVNIFVQTLLNSRVIVVR